MRAPGTSRTFLPWILFLAIVVLGGILLGLTLSTTHEQQLAQQGEWLSTLTRVLEKNLSNQLTLASNMLDTLRGGGYRHPEDIDQLALTLPGVRTILTTDATGRVVASSRKDLVGTSVATSSWFQGAQRNPQGDRLSLSRPEHSLLGIPLISAVKVLVGPKGSFGGVVSVSFDPGYYRALLDSIRDGNGNWARLYHGAGVLYLDVTDGKYRFDSAEAAQLARRASAEFRQYIAAQVPSLVLTQKTDSAEQAAHLSAFRTVQPAELSMDYPFVVEVGQDLSMVFRAWRRDDLIAWGAFSAAVLVLATMLFSFQVRQRRHQAETKRYTNLIRESSLRFQMATEAAHLGVWEWNPSSDALTWDAQMFALYQIDSAHFTPVLASWNALIAEPDREKAVRQLQFCVTSREPSHRLFRIVGTDGQFRWIQCTARYHAGHDGTGPRIIGINEDVTQRVVSARSLIESEHFLRTITETIRTKIAYFSADEVCQFANSGYANTHGIKVTQLVGQSLRQILGPTLYPERQSTIEQVMLGKLVELQGPFPDVWGNVNHLWIHYLPDVQDGVVEGFFVLVEDISELKAAQAEVEAQQGKLILNARMAQMGEMLSLIAHQWRQPLTVISALVGNVQLRSQLGSLDTEYLLPKLEKINQTVVFLSNTIESFRTFYAPAKQKDEANLVELTVKALELLSPVLKNQTLDIRFAPPAQPIRALVFQAELMQVIIEILTNALYAVTPTGGWVSLEWTRDRPTATLNIANNGGAIPDENLESIFLPYFTTKPEGTGTGMGLYMAKVIVETHHEGTLSVSCSGDITTFRITIPVEVSA